MFGMRVENGDGDGSPKSSRFHESESRREGGDEWQTWKGREEFPAPQTPLRCALRSWSRPCGPRPGACGRAGGGGRAREGGAPMSHSTGGAAGGGARRRPP